MAKVVERPSWSALYEADFHAWAEKQAELLRARRFDRVRMELQSY